MADGKAFTSRLYRTGECFRNFRKREQPRELYTIFLKFLPGIFRNYLFFRNYQLNGSYLRNSTVFWFSLPGNFRIFCSVSKFSELDRMEKRPRFPRLQRVLHVSSLLASYLNDMFYHGETYSCSWRYSLDISRQNTNCAFRIISGNL